MLEFVEMLEAIRALDIEKRTIAQIAMSYPDAEINLPNGEVSQFYDSINEEIPYTEQQIETMKSAIYTNLNIKWLMDRTMLELEDLVILGLRCDILLTPERTMLFGYVFGTDVKKSTLVRHGWSVEKINYCSKFRARMFNAGHFVKFSGKYRGRAAEYEKDVRVQARLYFKNEFIRIVTDTYMDEYVLLSL